MIIGIDPSFSSTGISCISDDGSIQHFKYDTFHAKGMCYQGNEYLNQACRDITESIEHFLLGCWDKTSDESISVIVEVPAPSKSGFYLSTLHGWIMNMLYYCQYVHNLYTVPCLACDSLIKNKLHIKSFIVKYCKDNKWMPDKRINNDVATAVVLAHVLIEYRKHNYKNKLFVIKELPVDCG